MGQRRIRTTTGPSADPAATSARGGGPAPGGVVPVTPKRLVRVRWIALGGAVVWTVLVSLEVAFASTTVTGAYGHRHSESLAAADTAGVVSFIVFLFALDAVTAVGFLRRVREGSERWSVPGAVWAGVLGALGILSLASIGLALVLLAFLLFVVSRPIQRPRPILGERLAPAPDAPTPAHRPDGPRVGASYR